LTSQTVVVQTLDDGLADPTRYFTINLSNPTGGAITSGQGIGTILDDTKFYVVDGGSSDSTYQYASSGTGLGNNALGSGDTAPRGVATTAAGTTEWVVDANKTVYVYNTAGTLLGSWSVGGLSSSAQLNGIATNGTDIWLLDNYTHKVYEYAGAASRLSGSQGATSSFSLASGKRGNTNGKGIVTDGTSFWVVDGSQLKVFKYTLSGSLLGSWTIDPANAHPTGITINPTNVSDIWIVDNGTDKVYQYIGAASRTSGSQNAGATFALAAGNTNPQGIADRPPADMLLTAAGASAAPNPPPDAAANPKASGWAPVFRPLTARDAVFSTLTHDSAHGLTGRAIDFLAGVAVPVSVDTPALLADRALPSASASGGQKPLDPSTPLTPGSIPSAGSGGSAVDLPDGTSADEAGEAPAADVLSGGLADVVAAEE
jgi:hypothetical protein